MDMKLKIAAFLATVLIASGCATQSTNPENSPDTTDPTHSGNLQLYISDQPAAIDSFQYLNVTLSEVRIYAETGNETDTSSTNSTNSTNSSQDDSKGYETFNTTATVDLTQLKGENATSVLEGELQTGNYSKMELEASNVEAQIDNSSVDVKLPSGKLQLTKSFTIAPNQTTEFVFDIQVVQRGTQGYILRPVISQSGTVGQDLEINRKEMGSRPESRGPEEGGNRTGGRPGGSGPEDVPA